MAAAHGPAGHAAAGAVVEEQPVPLVGGEAERQRPRLSHLPRGQHLHWIEEVNEEMSKKDEEMKNLIQEIHGIKEIRYHQKEIAEQNKAIQEQNKELKEMLQKALSGAGRVRR